jgi:hypothetical protein
MVFSLVTHSNWLLEENIAVLHLLLWLGGINDGLGFVFWCAGW